MQRFVPGVEKFRNWDPKRNGWNFPPGREPGIHTVDSLIENLLQWLVLAPFLVGFLGAFVTGTVVTVVLATFAGSSDVSPWPILAGAFLGNYFKDLCLFGLGRSRLTNWVRNSERYQARSQQLDRLRNAYRKRDWLFFIAVKFAYGLRIAQVILFGTAHYPWKRFAQLNALGVGVINAAAVLSGWSFGKGVTRYKDMFETTGTVVSFIALILILFAVLRWLINRYTLGPR